MSNPDAPTTSPRRRGKPPEPTVSQPVTVASGEEAPILLQLPELPRDESLTYAAPPTDVDEAAVSGVVAQNDNASDDAYLADDLHSSHEGDVDETEDYPADQPSSSEVRERRRKRRERQEPDQNVWSTTSGRITIGSGILLVCLVLVVILLPGGESDEPEGAWNQDSITIEAPTAGESSDAPSGAQALLASGNSVETEGAAWNGETPDTISNEQWQPVSGQGAIAADDNRFDSAPGLRTNESLAVQSSYDAPPKLAQSTYTPPPTDAYATQPANANMANPPYLQPAGHVATEPTAPAAQPYAAQPYTAQPYAAQPNSPPTRSPGTYLGSSGTQVASKTNGAAYLPQATMQPTTPADQTNAYKAGGNFAPADNPPYVVPASAPSGPGANDVVNPYKPYSGQ